MIEQEFVRCPFQWMLCTQQVDAIKALRADRQDPEPNACELSVDDCARIARVANERLNLFLAPTEAQWIWQGLSRLGRRMFPLDELDDDAILYRIRDVLANSFVSGFLQSIAAARLLSLNGGIVYQMILWMQEQEKVIDELNEY